jgi:Ca-activated chloride channel homolog
MRVFVLFCLYPAFLLCPAIAPQFEDNYSDLPTIRVDVDLVSLPVVVAARDGKRITNLKREDFQVFEDSMKQQIAGFSATDEPVKVALLLDISDSTEPKLPNIQNAAMDFVKQLHPKDEVAVLTFAQNISLQQDFSKNRKEIEHVIKNVHSGGWTAVYEAVWIAMEEVLKPVNDRKALVIFSDGEDNYSHSTSMEETLDMAKETRATIYCVYYNKTETGTGKTIKGNGWNYLSKLAEDSGGLIFDGNDDLSSAFGETAKELASLYSIGYYPQNTKHDGKFRKISVKVNKPGLVARTKKGYFAKKSE